MPSLTSLQQTANWVIVGLRVDFPKVTKMAVSATFRGGYYAIGGKQGLYGKLGTSFVACGKTYIVGHQDAAAFKTIIYPSASANVVNLRAAD